MDRKLLPALSRRSKGILASGGTLSAVLVAAEHFQFLTGMLSGLGAVPWWAWLTIAVVLFLWIALAPTRVDSVTGSPVAPPLPDIRIDIMRLTVNAPGGVIGPEPVVLAALSMRNAGGDGIAHRWTLLLGPNHAIGKEPQPFKPVPVKEEYDPGDVRTWRMDEQIVFESKVAVKGNNADIVERFFYGKLSGVAEVTKELLGKVRMEFRDSAGETRYSSYVMGNVHLGLLNVIEYKRIGDDFRARN